MRCLAQGHLDRGVEDGDRTSNLPVSSQPALPPELYVKAAHGGRGGRRGAQLYLAGDQHAEHEWQAGGEQLLAVIVRPDGGELCEQRERHLVPGELLGPLERRQPHVEPPRNPWRTKERRAGQMEAPRLSHLEEVLNH